MLIIFLKFKSTVRLFSSKPEAAAADSKVIDTAGQVNNYVVVTNAERIDVKSIELIILEGIICFIQIVKFIHCLYAKNQKKFKKRYQSTMNLNRS